MTTDSDEEWRAVAGWPEYDVSNQGRVRSWKRLGQRGPKKNIRAEEPRLLSPSMTSTGYRSAMFLRDGKQQRYLVHRLVALAFLGRPDADRNVCCHNDGNPLNNRLDNLRWDSMKGNMADKVRHGTSQGGLDNPRAKLTGDQVLAIAAALDEGGRTNRQIADDVGVTIGCVAHISTGNTWGSVTGRPNVSRIGSGRVGGSRKKRRRRAEA